MQWFYTVLRATRKAKAYLQQNLRRAWEYTKKHPVKGVLFVLIPYLLVSCVIGAVLFMLGGWSLLVAYIMCKLTGMCPI